MNPKNYPGKGFTCDAQNLFLASYPNLSFPEGGRPFIRAPRQAAQGFQALSELRRKDWQSTTRWNEAADFTGLLGEVAVQRYLGIDAINAMNDFKAGLLGDYGHDILARGLKLDIKSTQGSALKYKFSKSNPNANRCDGFIFCYVEHGGLESRVSILGWAHRADIKPYLRDDGVRFFVRAETLRRQGLLKPAYLLKETTPDNTSNTIQQAIKKEEL
jgi:hypothetical protein